MNITSTSFATHARTWLLIAGLTALLVGIGALIGGGFLYLFAGLAVAFNVVGYWFSDRLALRSAAPGRSSPGTMPELEAMVQDLARRAQVPAPRLYTIPSEQPNAFATGRNPRHAAVAVTEGLLRDLPPDQVKGVLAHEFAAHQEPRHPRLVDRRDGGRRDRRDRRTSSSGRCSSAERRRGRRAARLDRAARDDHRRADRGRRCSSSPSRASASTSPTRPGRSSWAAPAPLADALETLERAAQALR